MAHEQTNEQTKQVTQAIRDLFDQATNLAMDEVKRLVISILQSGKFDHFNMSMGRATFWFPYQRTLDEDLVDQLTIKHTAYPYDDGGNPLPLLFDEAEKTAIKDLYAFIDKHDDELRLTGNYLHIKWEYTPNLGYNQATVVMEKRYTSENRG